MPEQAELRTYTESASSAFQRGVHAVAASRKAAVREDAAIFHHQEGICIRALEELLRRIGPPLELIREIEFVVGARQRPNRTRARHRPGCPLVLCDAGSRVCWANTSALAILARGSCIRIRNGLATLSPAESRIAAALCCGLTIDEYARNSRVTVGTARFQSKQVLAKAQANRQADLVRQVYSSVIAAITAER